MLSSATFLVTTVILVLVMCRSVVGEGVFYAVGWPVYCGNPKDQLPEGTYYICFSSDDGPPQDSKLSNADIFTNSDDNFVVAFGGPSGEASFWTNHHPVQVRISSLQGRGGCVDYSIGATEVHIPHRPLPPFQNVLRFCQGDGAVSISK
ncbi:hypothetical protein [Sporisorium scitamineum]|uniref:Uncharacterized protein n=1 Tax=Sporisorium scitamineum TaxID=49012 RepID=A0A0F7S1R4_9BASI|nr:hypothetical protein [Sporisorium scitamineum]